VLGVSYLVNVDPIAMQSVFGVVVLPIAAATLGGYVAGRLRRSARWVGDREVAARPADAEP